MALHKRLGALLYDCLGDVQGARQAYAQVLELDCSDGEALGALADIFRTHRQWRELVDILQTMAELASDDAELGTLNMEAAHVAEHCLADLALAEGYARQVLELAPEHAEARALLERVRQG